MHVVKFGNPTFRNIGRVSSKRLCEFEKTWSGLHIADLVNDNDRKHSATLRIFIGRYLIEKIGEARVVRFEGDTGDHPWPDQS
jgi:hypothetical protein